jgi:hypothetical protein
MKGVRTTPEMPLGFQSELRRFRKTQRAYDSYLHGAAFGKGALGPRGVRGGFDPSFGAFDDFHADHSKALESFRSVVGGTDLSVASDLIARSPGFAGLTTGIGKTLRDDITKTARIAGVGGLSETIDEAAQIAMRSSRIQSRAIGADPDFVRDASSIAFGGSARTRDLDADARGALGLSGKRWNEQFEKITKGFAPTLSQTSTTALAGLSGVVADQADFGKLPRETLRAIRGVAPGPEKAAIFDITGVLPVHPRWGPEELSLIDRGIVDQARTRKLSRTVLAGSAGIAPDISELASGIFDSSIGPWAKSGIFGGPTLRSAFELNTVFGVGAPTRLRGLDPTAFGIGLDPEVTRGLIRDLGTEFDFARGLTDSSVWTGLRGFTSPTKWSDLLATAEAALDLPVPDVAGELDDEDENGVPTPAGVARGMRERDFWVPIPSRRDGVLWLNFLVAIDTVSEAITAGDPRKVLFALMSLAALTMTWPGDSPPRD